MKKMNKKGFTIVELVIVIAVIAILAAVMIPTFSGIIKKANQNAVLQKATAEYKEAYALALSDGKIDENDANLGDGEYKFTFTGTLDEITCTVSDTNNDGWTVAVDENGAVTVTEGDPEVEGDEEGGEGAGA